MPNRPPQHDPEASWVRKTTAARRVGAYAKCSHCDETRPEALIRKSKPRVCHECKRNAKGQTTTDDHHFGAEANSPITIPVPVNDHRAELSVAEYDWPKKTRENPDGSPLLAAAGCLRGFIDSIHYLMTKGLVWVADMLEAADAFLANKLGPKWWIGTELEKFAPKHKPRSPRESR